MPLPDHFLEILRCPQDGTRLHLADAALVDRLNCTIAAGRLSNVAGEAVERALDGGLIREAADRLYPVFDQIPVLLPDEAIDLTRL